VLVVSQIEVINRHRLIEIITAVDRDIIKKVEDSIIFILGIIRPL